MKFAVNECTNREELWDDGDRGNVDEAASSEGQNPVGNLTRARSWKYLTTSSLFKQINARIHCNLFSEIWRNLADVSRGQAERSADGGPDRSH